MASASPVFGSQAKKRPRERPPLDFSFTSRNSEDMEKPRKKSKTDHQREEGEYDDCVLRYNVEKKVHMREKLK